MKTLIFGLPDLYYGTMTYEIGTIYHGLRLTDFCGGGAYGDVYVCTDISGRRLAVKIVSKIKLGDDWERELRGVQAYMAVMRQSDHLLQLRHVGIEQDTLFYIMPACDPYPGMPGYLPGTYRSM